MPADGLSISSPSLLPVFNEDIPALLDHPEDCLEVLLAMQALTDDVVIEWPEGETFKRKPTVSLSNLNLSLMRQRD